jgi:hypothetical protein
MLPKGQRHDDIAKGHCEDLAPGSSAMTMVVDAGRLLLIAAAAMLVFGEVRNDRRIRLVSIAVLLAGCIAVAGGIALGNL